MKRLFSPVRLISFIESAKASDRWLLRILLFAMIGALIWSIIAVSSMFTEATAGAGGHWHEGILGTPRFVNPVLAQSQADRDMVALVYSGLLKIDANGELTTDLASDWTVTDDGLTYVVSLRRDATFHDGVPVTSEDVAFTIDLIQNDALNSPRSGEWVDVSLAVIDAYTIEFTLTEPYAPFLYNLTLGVLPAHEWRGLPVEQLPFSNLNLVPVGSGPYEIADTRFADTGAINRYRLNRADNHYAQPLIKQITVSFYDSVELLEQALASGDVDATAYASPTFVTDLAAEGLGAEAVPQTRVFGLFFNQNRSAALRDAAVREALDIVIDRDQIIAEANLAARPRLFAGQLDDNALESNDQQEASATRPDSPIAVANDVLEAAGWSQNADGLWQTEVDESEVELTVVIKTSNAPVFNDIAKAVQTAWESLGVSVAIEQYERNDLARSVIGPRDFEVLLFGVDPGYSQNLYPLWHSSQRDDPGSNISQYTNLTVDDALEVLQVSADPVERTDAINTINTVIYEEKPALLLFTPTVQYVYPNNLTESLPPLLTEPADRFSTVSDWYIETDSIWPIFNTD